MNVQIKSLEWVDHTKGPGCPIRRIAQTSTCVVWLFQAGEADLWYLSYNSGLNGKFLVKGDEAEAKAAAQADFNRRILSALAPAVSAEPVAYSPQLLRYDGEGDPYWEIVNADVASVTDAPVAANVEFIRDLQTREVIGLRVYDPSSPVSAEVTEAWWPEGPFKFGDRVEKPKGSSWHGKVCGWYTTSLTPVGYCVESEREPGSVQLYPVAALASLNGGRENG